MARKKATKEASVMLITPRDKFVPKKFYDRNAWSIQVKGADGKVRGKIVVNSNTTEEEMKDLALTIDNVRKFINDKEIVKVIAIPKKIVNIVVK